MATYPDTMTAALAASAREDTTEALRLFAQASAIEPGNGVPHLLMAGELMQAGDAVAAEAAYANALLVAPGLAIARWQLGLLQFTQGRAALALVTWQPLLEAGPEDALARFVCGFEALAHDDFARAEQELVRGMQLNTANAALNRDIQHVLDRIHPLMTVAVTAGSAGSPSSADSADCAGSSKSAEAVDATRDSPSRSGSQVMPNVAQADPSTTAATASPVGRSAGDRAAKDPEPPVTAAAVAGPPATEDSSKEDAAHVLLSNYQQPGWLH